MENSQKLAQLEEVLEQMEKLNVPERLQPIALKFLLYGSVTTPNHDVLQTELSQSSKVKASTSKNTGDLREFMSSLNKTGAVAEIPALLYWARENEGLNEADEKMILTLYRRAGVRPPKNIPQSMRDLSSKKYMRLESVKEKKGFVKLGQTGEDIVLHELINE